MSCLIKCYSPPRDQPRSRTWSVKTSVLMSSVVVMICQPPSIHTSFEDLKMKLVGFKNCGIPARRTTFLCCTVMLTVMTSSLLNIKLKLNACSANCMLSQKMAVHIRKYAEMFRNCLSMTSHAIQRVWWFQCTVYNTSKTRFMRMLLLCI